MTENKPIQEADYNASQIADYFVYLSSQRLVDENIVEGITPLRLQKFLYFAQAAAVSLYNKKIFKEDIQAWKYGPVVPLIYRKYKNKLNEPITEASGDYHAISEDSQKFLKEVWRLFDKYSTGELVEITHQHAPWKNNYREDQNIVIPPEVLRDYYKDIFEPLPNSDGGK